jgi:hypothetical protein
MKLIDLEMDDEEQLDRVYPLPMDRAKYPPEMIITFNESTLEKLGMDCDCDEGDIVDIRAFGTIKSVHKEAGSRSVCVQIEKIAVENEMEEE